MVVVLRESGKKFVMTITALVKGHVQSLPNCVSNRFKVIWID